MDADLAARVYGDLKYLLRSNGPKAAFSIVALFMSVAVADISTERTRHTVDQWKIVEQQH